MAVINFLLQNARVFGTNGHFRPSLIFADKAGQHEWSRGSD
jgi:hypothetical protein